MAARVNKEKPAAFKERPAFCRRRIVRKGSIRSKGGDGGEAFLKEFPVLCAPGMEHPGAIRFRYPFALRQALIELGVELCERHGIAFMRFANSCNFFRTLHAFEHHHG